MSKREINGYVLAPGVAAGTLCFVDVRGETVAPEVPLSESEVRAEIAVFEREVRSAVEELREAAAALEKAAFTEESEIIRTQVFMLEDQDFHRRVRSRIELDRRPAVLALETVVHEITQALERTQSAVFVERKADVEDVMIRLRKKLNREERTLLADSLDNNADPVAVAGELLPSMILEAHERGVRAFVVEKGTSLSHAAILAKSFGIPVLRIEHFHNLGVPSGTPVIVDALSGLLLLQPADTDTEVMDRLAPVRAAEIAGAPLPFSLWLNIVDPLQVNPEMLDEVEGIGLYRTEFLFMTEREDFPAEDEQYAVYSSLFERCGSKPVTIRTLDIGSDKNLPYFTMGIQENPALGLRAHRVYRFHPEIFVTQIRAILRAARPWSRVRLMYPMIESAESLFFLQALLRNAVESLEREHAAYNPEFTQGVLIEVPSAVIDLRRILSFVDFVSIGTNDLLQYLFAIDRNNANVVGEYRLENPLAVGMLADMIGIAGDMGRSMSICGEAASDVYYLPLLIGLGLKHISVDYHSIPEIRRYFSSVDPESCVALADACRTAATACDVKKLLDDFYPLDYRFETPEPRAHAETVDPVCRMVVPITGNRISIRHKGRQYYFCSRKCLNAFIETHQKK